MIVPPDEYMPKLRRICDETGVLLIADEVMSGWGRTGKWFAMEHWGVTPDILTTAKGNHERVCAAWAVRDFREDRRVLQRSLLRAWTHLLRRTR